MVVTVVVVVVVVVAVSGQTPNVAEMNFLVAATQLDTYAVDPHPVKVCGTTRHEVSNERLYRE